MSETLKNHHDTVNDDWDMSQVTMSETHAEAEARPDALEEKKDILKKLDEYDGIPDHDKYDIVGLVGGVKSAAIFDKETEINSDKVLENLLDQLDIHYVKTIKKELIYGQTPVDYSERLMSMYYVSKTKQLAELTQDLLKKSKAERQTGDATRKLGQLLGYPKTAVEYYIRSSKNGLGGNYFSKPKYHSYIHSLENAEEEYQQYEQRIDQWFKTYCPNSANAFFQNLKERRQKQSHR